MLKRVLMALLAVVAVAGFAQVANAQYMWLDANANGVHDTGDLLNANGTPTTVDVYVRTNQNRDGSTALCNDNPATLMTINQYQANLLAVGGTVTYTNFINQQAGMTFGFGEFNPGDGLRYKNGFGGGTQLAPGTYRVMTITITGVSGSPRVDLVDQVAGSPDFTGFGTACPGQDFDSLYKLDGPNVLAATGHAGDFFDADGVAASGPGPNSPPVLGAIGNRTVNELATLAFTATATDSDAGQTLTFSLDAGAPAGATIGGASGAFSWTPTEAQGPGSFPITVRVTDNATPTTASDFELITVTVNEVNVAPVVTSPGNRTVNELANLAFTVTATDADIPANTIAWSLTLGTPAATGATIGAGGAFSWTPTEAQGPGTYPVTIVATDNGTPALSGNAAITIMVNEVNVAPVLAAIGNKTGTVGTPVTFTATATDADVPANTLTFSLDAGAPAGATISGSTGAFSWTPSAAGTFPVTVRVTDNGTPAMNDFEAISITVGPAANQPPVLGAIGNRTVNELATLAFTATATDPDAGQTLTFSLDAGAPAGATINGSTGAFSWTPTEAQGPGSFPITVRVTDNATPTTASDFELITVTVNEVNVAPVVTNPGNRTVNELANLAFTVTATDADIPANTIAWSLTLGTPAATGATIGAGTGAFSWTPTEAQGPGTYPVTIVATDNGTPALSGNAAITITVNEVNVAPVVTNPGNRTTAELVNLAFTVTATDADVPANTIAWSLTLGTPAATGATIGAGGAFSWTPTEAQGPGTYPVTIVATDNGTPALSGNAAITITVTEVNVAPVLGTIGNKTGTVGVPVTFTATATDADVPANTLTFSLDAGAPAGATINGSTGAFTWTPSANGTFPVTVRVTDNGTPALNDFEAISITVSVAPNNPPTVTNPGNKTTAELVNLAFTVTATDPDAGQTLAFSLDAGAPAGATIGAATGAFSWTPTEAQGPGVFPVTIRATDNGTPPLSGSAAITITVNDVNNVAPVVTNPGNKTTAELANLAFTVTATDADIPAQPITWSLTLGTPAATGATIGAGTGAFSWTPTEAQGPGTYPVTITASDNGTPALSDNAAITITVTEVNVAPVLAAIGNKTGTVAVPVTFTATATDADIPANTLTFSLDAGAPAGATIGGATGAFSWTPSAAGTFPVTVRVTDNGTPALNDFEAITITVGAAANQAPVLGAIGNKTVAELATLTFTATATDPNSGDVLTFSLDAGAPAGATIGGASGAFSWTPTEAQGPGSFPITVRVTDNGSPAMSDFEAITVTVTEVNVAPVLAAIGNKTGTVAIPVTFTATATDADIPANTLTFSLDAGAPAGATIGGATGAFSWTPSAAGTFPVTVRVTDNGTPALNDFEAITITVGAAANQAPVLGAIGNKTVAELATLTFTATATDPNSGDVLTFSLDAGSPAGATINGSTGAFSWTPTEAQGPSSNPITVRVTDNGSPAMSDFETITVTVTEVNVAPVLAAIGNKTGAVGTPTTFTATATDADIPSNALTFSLDAGAPAGATINGSTGAFTWTPSASGTFPVTVRVTDNGTPALNDFEAITITVGVPANQAPVLGAIGNKTVNELATLAFTATATDPDAGQTLTFSLDAGAPAGATIGGASGAFSWTPTEAQGPGSYPITVRVTDNGSPALNDFEQITVTVNEVNVAPVVTNPGNKTVDEFANLAFTVTATDADIPANTITWSLDAGSPAGATIGASSGAFSWTPSEAQGPGTYPVTIRATDNGTPAMSGTAVTMITVNEVNAAPTADADGPYTGSVNSDVNFDGTGSSDPDGDVLTYDWTFGDAGTGTGPTPTHSYAAEGTFDVTLRVTDPSGLFDDDATTATIRAEVQADIVLENNGDTIDARKTGNRTTTVGLEQQVLPYTDLVLNSIRISHTGPAGFVTECAPDSRYFVIGDLDADGILDADIRFTNKCLTNLFNNVPSGSVQSVVITGEFNSGGSTVPLHAQRDLTILVKHRTTPILVIASPNPFNPETAISYSVNGSGSVTMKIYSVDGRLVRTLKQGEETTAGTYEATWNGTDDSGRHVSSGIYFVKTTQKVGATEESAILKLALTK